MPQPKGPQGPRDLLGKIADNIESTSHLIRQLQQGLSSLAPSIQGATVSPDRVVKLPEQDDDSPIDRTNPPFVPEWYYACCVRCGYEWMPRIRHPKRCPRCVAPWWFPAHHRWYAKKPSRSEWRRGQRSANGE